MFYALSENGIRVFAGNAEAREKYICPACYANLILKQGQIVSHHFAHKRRKDCDPWYKQKNVMSEWHIKQQNFFPSYSQEAVVWNEDHTEVHRADVLFKGYVLEFQHSPISRKEFEERSLFYLRLGYRLIWVFDFCDCESQKVIMYSIKDPNTQTMHIVWPGQDRVRFLDHLRLWEYAELGQMRIFFHISTGLGKKQRHSDPNIGTWYKWHFVDPLYREKVFVEPMNYHWYDLSSLSVKYYDEKDFYERFNRWVSQG